MDQAPASDDIFQSQCDSAQVTLPSERARLRSSRAVQEDRVRLNFGQHAVPSNMPNRHPRPETEKQQSHQAVTLLSTSAKRVKKSQAHIQSKINVAPLMESHQSSQARQAEGVTQPMASGVKISPPQTQATFSKQSSLEAHPQAKPNGGEAYQNDKAHAPKPSTQAKRQISFQSARSRTDETTNSSTHAIQRGAQAKDQAEISEKLASARQQQSLSHQRLERVQAPPTDQSMAGIINTSFKSPVKATKKAKQDSRRQSPEIKATLFKKQQSGADAVRAFCESLPTEQSQRQSNRLAQGGAPEPYPSQSSIKGALEPLQMQRQQVSTVKQQGKVKQQTSVVSETQASLMASATGTLAPVVPSNPRQIKSIRNSFNNFFVTSKQSSLQHNSHQPSDQMNKFRMSSVEHRNELKNYLELSSLAEERNTQPPNQTALQRRHNPISSASTKMHESGGQSSNQRQQSNQSQLQALNSANAQLMPSILHTSGSNASHHGVRNQNNRTTLAHKLTKVVTGGAPQYDSLNGTTTSMQSSKMRRDKPYQSESYRIMANFSAQATQLPNGPIGLSASTKMQILASNPSAGQSTQTNGPKFLTHHRNYKADFKQGVGPSHQVSRSPMATVAQQANKLYTDQTNQMALTPLSQYLPEQPSVKNETESAALSQAANCQQVSTMPVKKFIKDSATTSAKLQQRHAMPARARTNLDNYHGEVIIGELSKEPLKQRQPLVLPSPPTRVGNEIQQTPLNHQEGYATKVDKTSAQTGSKSKRAASMLGKKASACLQAQSIRQSLVLPAKNQAGPYLANDGACQSVTLETEQMNEPLTLDEVQVKNKFKLNRSKVKMEALQSSRNEVSGCLTESMTSQAADQNHNTGQLHHLSLQQSLLHKASWQDSSEKNYTMLQIAQQPGTTSKRSQRSSRENSVAALAQKKPSIARESFILSTESNRVVEPDSKKRASRQPPLSVMQSRISANQSKTVSRCFSRQQKDHSQTSQADSETSIPPIVNSRALAQGLALEQDSLRLAGKLSQNRNSTQLSSHQKHDNLHQEMLMRVDQTIESNLPSTRFIVNQSKRRPPSCLQVGQSMPQKSTLSSAETERQLIIARGGSLSRKVHQGDDEEDIFNDRGGFRIKINKEQKVVNHLDDKVENNNLLFYNFNAYKQEPQGGRPSLGSRQGMVFSRQRQPGSRGLNEEPSENYDARGVGSGTRVDQNNRPYSRSSTGNKSRQDYRQRPIQSAQSTASMKSRKAISRQLIDSKKHSKNREKTSAAPPHEALFRTQIATQESPKQQILPQKQSCTSLDSQQIALANEQAQMIDLAASTDLARGSASQAGTSQTSQSQSVFAQGLSKKACERGGVSDSLSLSHKRYKQSSINQSVQYEVAQALMQVGHSSHNMTSSGSLTTAATTKGSGFGRASSQAIKLEQGSSSTPRRGSLSLLNEQVIVVPSSRPKNTSRVFKEHQNSSSTSSTRNQRRSSGVESDQKSQGGGQLRQSAFARSAMRLKQKSSRNGMPGRGGSLDGTCSTQKQAAGLDSCITEPADFAKGGPKRLDVGGNVSGTGIIGRAGRTAGGAVWSRMLNNMQSVEEGIQEGNVSSEDD